MANDYTVANGLVNGTFKSTESGGVHTPHVNAQLRDAAGNSLESSTTDPSSSARGLVSRIVGLLVNRPYAAPADDWSYAGASGGITNTSDVAIAAAAGSGIRNYLTALQVINSSATATEIVVKDGSTVIWRGRVGASMTSPVNMTFPTPLKSTANTALNFACITTSTATIVSAQGYKAA